MGCVEYWQNVCPTGIYVAYTGGKYVGLFVLPTGYSYMYITYWQGHDVFKANMQGSLDWCVAY